MTNHMKQYIAHMRNDGKSYAVIAEALGIPANTIKTHCRRHNLGAAFSANRKPSATDTCVNCGKPLEHRTGAKKKRFCSDKCRLAWWNAHPEAVNRKAFYRFVCPICGEEFETYGNARQKYCSRACYGTARRVSVG
jgi:endogenous inhibitor of DNA gyrase (YacG/DUF329 family)